MKKTASGFGASAPDRLRRIESRHNALVMELRRAFTQSHLTPDGHCAIEGLRMVEEAIRSGLKFRAVFFAESAAGKAERLLPQIGAHTETLLLPDKLLASAVPTDTPQGVAALVKVRTHQLEALISRSSAGPLVILSGVQDPGNLGTILRSAEAFGAAGVLLGEGTVSQYNSKAVRASSGSVFRLPMVNGPLDAVLEQLRERGVRLIATSSHKGTPLPQAKLTPPLALLIGNEGAGVPRDLLVKMDEVVAIPHSPNVESLNAGVAASIVLYEVWRQKG
jgi:TrmH family RNA methyltransferase